jgi:hypothetical protein
MKNFRVELQFMTDKGKRWTIRKIFFTETHLNNFVRYIIKTKGYHLDEIYNLD